jgi:ribose-phosphate pyrophosphokinase
MDRIEASHLKELVVTDTIPLGDRARVCPKIKQLSVSSLLAEAIRRIHEERSVSSLFV